MSIWLVFVVFDELAIRVLVCSVAMAEIAIERRDTGRAREGLCPELDLSLRWA
jgi:hypothetical protein